MLTSVVTVAQTGTNDRAARSASAALRTAWGEPDLMGVWNGAKLGASLGQDSFNLTRLESLYRPEVRAKMKQLSEKDDPTLRCFPHSFPHALTVGWPIQVTQSPGMLFVLNEAFHTYRIIPTNGRKHLSAAYLAPTFLGDAVGHWEGDMLVTDVISFNGRSWLASGQDKPTRTSLGVWPTSDAMHVVERWRRLDPDTLEYQARVEDPQMLTGPWDTPKIALMRAPVTKVEEVKCLVDDPAVPTSSYLKQFGR